MKAGTNPSMLGAPGASNKLGLGGVSPAATRPMKAVNQVNKIQPGVGMTRGMQASSGGGAVIGQRKVATIGSKVTANSPPGMQDKLKALGQ